ncbi:MAG: MotA/TolQ/ExbB proton channel family protein [Acidobacteriota bacterium]|nr:MotA/TolQ/ExbB proton channel family protein [Acidobacteriota bacterium]
MLNGEETQHAGELQSYHTFDSPTGACYANGIALSQRRTHRRPEARLRTLGSPLLALQVQGGSDSGLGTNVVHILARSSIVAKIILLILAVFSIVSWGIILYKIWVFRRAERQTRSFLEIFRRSSKFSEVQAVCKTLKDSPLVGIFQSGYAEITAQLRHAAPAADPAAAAHPNPPGGRPTLKSLAALDRALLRASSVEMNRLEQHVSFLATTASIAPFIGLFGTVWGIMSAFEGIGQTGSTNLGIVAPGIAEALIATAAGLFAAIPAVYFYNHLTSRTKLFASEMDDFSLEFLNIAERNFT